MAIDSAKLLNRPSKGEKLSAQNVEDFSIIATTVSDIAIIMKGSLVLDKMRDKKRRKKQEDEKRNLREKAREGLTKKVTSPIKQAAASAADWLQRLIKGVLLIGLVKLLPVLEPWIPKFTEFLDNLVKSLKWIFKFTVNLIDGAYKMYDSVRAWIGNKFGKGALEKFDSAMKHLNKFLNAALSAVVALLSFKWLRKLVKNVLKGGKTLLKNALQIAKRGASRIVKRTILKVGGKNALKTAVKATNVVKNVASKGTTLVKKGATVVGKKISGLAGRIFGKSAGAIVPGLKGALGPLSKFFARVPVIGPLIVGIFSVLSGEPGGKALFRMVGAGLGEFLGGALAGALAVGTAGIGALVAPALVLLGGTIGTWLGGVLYDLIQGGGIGAMKKKLGELVKGIFEKILDIGDWLRGGFSRFIKTFLQETAVPIKSGWGVRSALTTAAEKLGIFDWLKEIDYVGEKDKVVKFPNLLQLYNPFKLFPILKDSFFPVKDAAAEGKKITAEKKAKEDKEKGDKDTGGGEQSLEEFLEEPSNAKTEPVEAGDEKTPLTLAEMGDNKPSSANGLDQHPSYSEDSPEGKTAFVPIATPVGGGDTTSVDLEDTSSASNSSSEMSDAMYAGS